MKRRCVSSPLSLKNTLTSIYGHLRHPRDMRSFMLVNKLFHKAGAEWGGYGGRIEKLLERCGGKYPFQDEYFLQYQYFFALCFISCKTDEELSEKIFKHMREEKKHLALYCRNLGFPLPENGHLRDVFLDRDGYLAFPQYDNDIFWCFTFYGSSCCILILDNKYFYFPKKPYSTTPVSVMPIEELRNKCAEI